MVVLNHLVSHEATLQDMSHVRKSLGLAAGTVSRIPREKDIAKAPVRI